MNNPLATDLDFIIDRSQKIWSELRGERIFITGGTGFFGCWLLESFAWANDKLGLDAEAIVLTRDAQAFQAKAPHLATHRAIKLHIGDVRSFDFPQGTFSHVIHAATEASATLNQDNPLLMLDTIVEGTRHTLDFAKVCGAKKFLLTSSGAVYGKQPSEISHISEDYLGASDPMDSQSAYAEGKRLAELLCSIYAQQYEIETKIARCFAFVGPYLPIDIHFAVGNFIRDAIDGKTINVNGDGTPYRSYLYAADLAIWLWTILVEGRSCQPYNVGSDTEITIADVAKVVARSFVPEVPIKIAKQAVLGQKSSRYVPAIERAKIELNLQQTIDLETAVQKTVNWYLSGD